MKSTGRKLRSLLELGQLIGLDLHLNEMLFQIAKKAAKMMQGDCRRWAHLQAHHARSFLGKPAAGGQRLCCRPTHHVQGKGGRRVSLFSHSGVLPVVLTGMLKNGVEGTPNGGTVRVIFGKCDGKVYINVVDYGIGITEENRRYLFDGLFPARETESYTSRKPYQFGAGGKGLDLLRARLYSEQFDFEVCVRSRRCVHLPTDRDLCAGDVMLCTHCEGAEGINPCGETTFALVFPASRPETGRSTRRIKRVAA